MDTIDSVALLKDARTYVETITGITGHCVSMSELGPNLVSFELDLFEFNDRNIDFNDLDPHDHDRMVTALIRKIADSLGTPAPKPVDRGNQRSWTWDLGKRRQVIVIDEYGSSGIANIELVNNARA